MIVCVCRRVSDRDIEREVRQGCNSFDDLQIDLGVATSCGACTDCAVQTFEGHLKQCGREAMSRRAVAAVGFSAKITVHREAMQSA